MRHHRLLTILLFMALCVPWIPSYFEWDHYAHNTILLTRKPWSLAELPLVWVFYAKTQLLLAPFTILAALLVARGWWRTGWATYALWLTAVLLWLEVDKQTYSRTNVHLHEYLKFLRGPSATMWAGNLHAMQYLAQVAMESTFKLSAIPLLIGVLGSAALWRHGARRFAPRVLRGLAWMVLIAFLAVAPAQWLYRDRFSLEQLHALLPFNFRWSAPGRRFADTSQFARPLNERLQETFERAWPALYAGIPADSSARFDDGPRPNVILIVVESLRADSLAPEIMPRLYALGRRGLNLSNHSAGAKISHYGLYNLLYARPGLAYYATVNHKIPPQACVTFKKSGYQTHYLSSADHRNWMSMDYFVNEPTFDRMQLFLGGSWPACDHQALKELGNLAGETSAQPRFLTAFIISTHFPYWYPDAFARRSPVVDSDWAMVRMDKERDRIPLLNRYHNACSFIDDEIGKLVESLDLSRNLVIITGDHGESFWDDGVLVHGGRWSDVQFRVPCVLIGAGVTPGEMTRRTFHQDLLPTALHLAAGRQVPLRNITGRDLLSNPPESPYQILCSEATDEYGQFLLTGNDGRRLLMEMPANRAEIIVNGTVDPLGRIDPFNVPPAGQAPDWAGGLAEIFRQLTAPVAPNP